MVRILSNGDIDDSPVSPRQRNQSSSNPPPRQAPSQNEAVADATTGPAELFHYANERLLNLGIPRIPVGDYVVEPLHLIIAVLALVLFGPIALIAVAIVVYISQQGGTAPPVTRPSAPSSQSAPSPSAPRQNPASSSSNKFFTGTGQRLGS